MNIKMKTFHPSSLATKAIAALSILYAAESTPLALHAIAVTTVSGNPSSRTQTQTCNRYTPLPSGQTTYEIDDGGCFFCGKFPGSTIPLSGDELSTHCQQLCDADSECFAFAIARSAVLHAHEYHWGNHANCCLDRTQQPEELWVDGYNVEDGREPNECEMDAMCWTRQERNPQCSHKETAVPSDQCSLVWKARTFTDEQIQKRIDFIADGCPFGGDDTFEQMSKEAYAQCKAEVDAELGKGIEGAATKAKDKRSSSSTLEHPSSHRAALIAHGTIGFIVFGLLVPASIAFAFFRDLLPIYTNVIIFTMTFITVCIAFATMNSMGNAGEGHLKEIHHLVGLLLLLLVSFQTAHACSRPPLEYFPDEERDIAAGAKHSSKINDSNTMAFKLWHYLHSSIGLFIFLLGTYQVRSGLGLFSKRFSTPDKGKVHIGYIGGFIAMILIGKLLMKWKERRTKSNDMEMEMGRNSMMTFLPQNGSADEQLEFA